MVKLVLIDEHLSFSGQADYITNKIAKSVNVTNMYMYLSEWSKLVINKMVILSHFNYCSKILFILTTNRHSTDKAQSGNEMYA